MPLARIVTRYPEHASDFAQQLQLQGFSVELADPDEIDLSPADLEIDFEICNPAQVAELGADVVLASGALDLAAKSSADAPLELTPAALEDAPQAMQPAAVQAIDTQFPEAPPTEETLPHELPAYNTHFASNLGTQLRESLSDLGMAAMEIRKRLSAHLRAAADSVSSRMAVAKANLTSAAHEYQERMKQKAAEAQAERDRRPMEAASLQAEEQSANLQTEGQSQELQQEKQRELAAAAIPQPLPARPPAASARRPAWMQAQRPPLQLRGIFTGAAAASILFVIGMVLANIHPQSPLPAGMTQGPVEQHVPFGAVIVQGRPAQPRVNVAQPPPKAPAPATLKPQERIPTVNQSKPHPYHAKNRSAHASDDDGTADDVVVRHYPARVTKPVQQAQQVKLKRYSDMDR